MRSEFQLGGYSARAKGVVPARADCKSRRSRLRVDREKVTASGLYSFPHYESGGNLRKRCGDTGGVANSSHEVSKGWRGESAAEVPGRTGVESVSGEGSSPGVEALGVGCQRFCSGQSG